MKNQFTFKYDDNLIKKIDGYQSIRGIRHGSNRPDIVIIDCYNEFDKTDLDKHIAYLQEISLSMQKQNLSALKNTEYYNLSKRYEKLLLKLMRMTDSAKIEKTVDDFLLQIESTTKFLNDNFHDAHLYIGNIMDMEQTLIEFKNKNK